MNIANESFIKWIRADLDDLIREARISLEDFAEGSRNEALMAKCAQKLHQIFGTLKMVQLQGAALLAEEMEAVAEGMNQGTIHKIHEASEALMMALVQLPDHIDRVQAGEADLPIGLISGLNELRAVRDEPPYTERALFAFNLRRQFLEQDVEGEPSPLLSDLAKDLRPHFHRGLLKWFRSPNPTDGIRQIQSVVDKLSEKAGTDRVRNFFRAGGAVTASVAAGALESGEAIKALMGKIDREIKRIIDEGEQVAVDEPPIDLYQNLLYYVAQSDCDDERVEDTKGAFDLSDLARKEGETQHGGINKELVDTVSEAVNEDLTKIKDDLDLYIRTGGGDENRIGAIRDSIAKLADTLKMLDQDDERQQLKRQVDKIDAWIVSATEPPESELMEVASSILAVESSLHHLALGTAGGSTVQAQPPANQEFDQLLSATLREASVDMAHIKEAISSFIANPNDARVLENTADRFKTVQGALNMLQLEEPAAMLANVASYVENRLGQSGAPDKSEIEALADVITSIEYFMESVADDLGQREDILDFTRGALTRLEVADEPQKSRQQEIPQQKAASVEELPSLELEVIEEIMPLEDGIEVEEEVADPEPERDIEEKAYKPEVIPELHDYEEESPDSEILDIFMEEANEELEVIQNLLPGWLADQSNQEALSRFRRSFHTLKGSGRLVGAEMVGEFAWSVENLLNRIIDGTVELNRDVTDLMQEVLEVLPQIIACEADKTEPDADYHGIMEQAFALAAGRTATEVEKREHPASEEAAEEKAQELAAREEEESEDGFGSFGFDLELEEPSHFEVIDGDKIEVDDVLQELDEIDYGVTPVDIAADKAPIELEETLRDIFDSESRGHIESIEDFIQECDPELGCAVGSQVTRALHTLHGSADMAGVTPIAQITKANERYFDALMEHQKPAHKEEIDLLKTTVEMTRSVLSAINVPGADLPNWEEHSKTLNAKLSMLEEAVSSVPDSDSMELTFVDPGGLISDSDSESLIDRAGHDIDGLTGMEREPNSRDVTPVKDSVHGAVFDPTVFVDEGGLEDIQGADDDLIEIFLEEAQELTEGLESALQAWQSNMQGKEPVAELQRLLHTLKGAARLAGVSQIGDLSHAFETLLTAVDHGKLFVDEGVMNVSRQVGDHLMSQVDTLASHRKVSSSTELIRRLEAVQKGEFEGQDAENATRETKPDAEAVSDDAGGDLESILVMPSEDNETDELPIKSITETTGSDKPVPDDKSTGGDVIAWPRRGGSAEPVSKGVAEPDSVSLPKTQDASTALLQATGMPARVKQDLIRVRSDHLDRMVNSAGEISIYRTRIEQQNGELAFNLDELDQTVSRLKQQLRTLEIETEAQILFRYERDKIEGKAEDQAGIENFDPLEMDRFSTIQQMSRSLAETVNDLVSIRDMMEELNRESETLLLQQSRVTNDLQDGLLRTRMVSFSQVVPRLERLVRQTSQALGKRAELIVEGSGNDLDRTILDRIVAPLEHILRNAVSHGIESPERRSKAGKAEIGRIRLGLRREGRDVAITIADDGAGIDYDAIRQRAIERGLMDASADVADEDLVQFLLEPGFSTASTITQVSGRGVGMDVVSSEVKQLGGTLDMDTAPGSGTSFNIRLPFTLALAEALLVNVGEDVFAIPHSSVEGVTRVSHAELEACYRGEQETISYVGNNYRVRYLGELLEFIPSGSDYLIAQNKWYPLLLVRHGDHRVAIHVDQMVGSRQIVVKSVGMQLSTVRWITGGTILGDGRVALILDVNALVRLADIHQRLAAKTEEDSSIPDSPSTVEIVDEERPITVMVVDDSITVRKVTSRLLDRHNMDVVTAKDGVDAVAQLQDVVPDVMLLDVEMPRMDGYELTRHIRHTSELKEVPIIMITSRSGDKHRQHAMDLGVNAYLGKPYQESELLDNIYALLAERS